MKSLAENSRNFLAVTFTVLLGSLLAGCATTISDEPEPWDPSRRAQAHVDLGMDYMRRGQFDVARKELDLAISIDSRSDSAYHGKGLLMAQTGHTEDAKRLLKKAVNINPENYGAANDYGIYLCENAEVSTGISVLKPLLDHPENELVTNTRLGLGICYFQRAELDLATDYLRLVLRDQPSLPQALLPMAEIAYRQANFLSARAFVERYVSNGAMSERILIVGANTELRLNDREKAAQYARELRRLYPQSPSLAGYRPLLTGG